MQWQTKLPFEIDILGRNDFETILNHKIKGKVATTKEERKEREVPQHMKYIGELTQMEVVAVITLEIQD